MNALKTVGTRTTAASPAESLCTGMKLRRIAKRLGKWKPARGFIVMGRTREEAELRWEAQLARTETKT